MTAVSAVDQCQHAQENYWFCGSNMVNLVSKSQLSTVKALQIILYYEHNTL